MNTNKENTWRTLQGLKPVQPWRCRLNWHRWTNYEVSEKTEWGTVYAICSCADCGLPRIERPYTTSKEK